MIFQLTRGLKEYISPFFFNSKMSIDQLICPVLSSHLPKKKKKLLHLLKVLCSPYLGLVADGAELRKRSGFFLPVFFPSISTHSPYSLSSLWFLLKQEEISGRECFHLPGPDLGQISKNYSRWLKMVVLFGHERLYGNHRDTPIIPSWLIAYISLHSMGID